MGRPTKLIADYRKLESCLSELQIRSSHLAMFSHRTNVMVNRYIKGRSPIPFWMWDVIERIRKMPLHERRARILGFNPEAKIIGLSDKERDKIVPIKP